MPYKQVSIITKKWKNQKPPIGSQIDWSHPLSRGLVGCWLMNEGGGTPRDLIRNRNSNYLGGNTGWRSGVKGYTPAFTGSTSLWVERDAGLESLVSQGTWLCGLKRNGNNGSYARAFGKTNNDGNSVPYLSYDIEYNPNNAGQNRVFIVFGSGTSYYQSEATGNGVDIGDTTKYHSVAGVFRNSTLFCYVNGILNHSRGGLGNVITYDTSSTGRFIISGSSSASSASQWNGDIYYIYIYNRALSPSEITQLYQDSYCFIQPTRRRFYFQTGEAPAANKPTRRRVILSCN